MDPFHERLARVALEVAASYGFALAGGYAVQAHGFLDRPSADVDLFAEASAEFNFSEAVDAVIAAYQRDGLDARTEARSSSFARLSVSGNEESVTTTRRSLAWHLRHPHSGRPPQLVTRRFHRDVIEQGEQPLRQVDGTAEVDISQSGMTTRLDSASDGLIESG
jgi:hypothetical protein